VGRNSATTPTQATVHARVSRSFPLGGRSRVELLFEVFNLFNRTNYFESSNTSSTFIFGPGAYPAQPLATFGLFTQAGPPRQAQVGLRIAF
jgi:outer membrane receptor for Fe3+-dicitrate